MYSVSCYCPECCTCHQIFSAQIVCKIFSSHYIQSCNKHKLHNIHVSSPNPVLTTCTASPLLKRERVSVFNSKAMSKFLSSLSYIYSYQPCSQKTKTRNPTPRVYYFASLLNRRQSFEVLEENPAKSIGVATRTSVIVSMCHATLRSSTLDV